jgi:hypothetical protein
MGKRMFPEFGGTMAATASDVKLPFSNQTDMQVQCRSPREGNCSCFGSAKTRNAAGAVGGALKSN